MLPSVKLNANLAGKKTITGSVTTNANPRIAAERSIPITKTLKRSARERPSHDRKHIHDGSGSAAGARPTADAALAIQLEPPPPPVSASPPPPVLPLPKSPLVPLPPTTPASPVCAVALSRPMNDRALPSNDALSSSPPSSFACSALSQVDEKDIEVICARELKNAYQPLKILSIAYCAVQLTPHNDEVSKHKACNSMASHLRRCEEHAVRIAGHAQQHFARELRRT